MTGTCDDCAYNVYDDEMDEYAEEFYNYKKDKEKDDDLSL